MMMGLGVKMTLYGLLLPREWMDVLSPPIMPPGRQRRSDGTGTDVVRGTEPSPTSPSHTRSSELNEGGPEAQRTGSL